MHARGIKVRRNKGMFDDMRKGGRGGRSGSRWKEGREEERWLLEVKYA